MFESTHILADSDPANVEPKVVALIREETGEVHLATVNRVTTASPEWESFVDSVESFGGAVLWAGEGESDFIYGESSLWHRN